MEKVREIFRKFGEMVFRLAANHLFSVGTNTVEQMDIEQAVSTLYKRGNNSNALCTAEMEEQILRCAYELSKLSLWDVLGFIKTDVEIEGAVVHPGIILQFHNDITGREYATYVVSAGADGELIEEAADEIAMNGKSTTAETCELIHATLKAKGLHPKPIEPDYRFGLNLRRGGK